MPLMDGFETVKQLKYQMATGKLEKGICIANTAFTDFETK
jgi:hypothetical protein